MDNGRRHMNPRISVIMPVWNGELYLAQAIDGILAQTFTDFELIVVDDGSTDSTPQILASVRDPRLVVVRLDHAGIVSALNAGIARARAPWIARQDADDISKPARLEKQWQSITQKKSAILSHTDVELIGEAHGRKQPQFPATKALIALKLCFYCPIVHSTVLFNKEAFHKAGGYLPGERHAEDYALWGRMIRLGDFAGVPEQLLSFRVHPVSVSRQNLDTQVALSTRIALDHCRHFMALTDAKARRAFAVLSLTPGPHARREQLWFLTHCLPRLQWKSAEAFAWFLLRCAKVSPRTPLQEQVEDKSSTA